MAAENLPTIYGGKCNCQAQCIYSEKGPWSDIVNVIDYQNKQITLTEQEWLDNRKYAKGKEEFKFEEDEPDQREQLDLLKDMFKLSKYFKLTPKDLQKSQNPKDSKNFPEPKTRQVQYAESAQNTLADE